MRRTFTTSLSILALATACSFPKPADVPSDGQPGVADAADGDAPPGPDAPPPDALPPAPITNNQAAYLELGQPDMNQNASNNGGISGFTMDLPTDVWSDGTRLWVADDQNARVLQYNAIPALSHAPASLAIGEANFTDRGSSVYEYKIANSFGPNQRLGGFTVGGKVLVADPGYNRVMIWGTVPTGFAQNASQVLGYSDFMGNGLSTPSASNFHGCSHLWSDGTKLAVVDSGHSRVLLWNNYPAGNGAAADLVIGTSSFAEYGGGLAPDKMSIPIGVWFEGKHLFVADQANNRVMVWNGWPTKNGQAADYFIGQADGNSGAANAGGSATSGLGLSTPRGVVVAEGALFVADAGNNRVLMYYPIPTTSGQTATAVLGQPDFVTNTNGVGPNKMYAPAGMGTGDGYLFVADRGNNRVLYFKLAVQ